MDIEVLPGNNGSSSNGSNGVTPKVTRKRQRRPETWTKNVKKMKRAKGEEYTTKSGKVILARKQGQPCKCKRKCFTKFTSDQPQRIFRSFNDLADKNLQDSHLFGLIRQQQVKRRRAMSLQQRNRTFTYVYRVSYLCVESG